MGNERVKVLMLVGPPGSGKNSLLDLYCKRHNIEVVRYREEQDSRYLSEALEIARDNKSYPQDLENIIHFLRLNAKQGERTAGAVKTSSFTAKKQLPVLVKTQQKRVIVFTGFPLCLKIFNPRRFEFIRDFNDALKQIVLSKEATPLIVFSLSDSQERVPSFLSKVLSKELQALRGSTIATFSLNPPTEKGIDKTLKHIAECEELCLTDAQLLEIRSQCNKDLRNAIITL